MSVKAREIIKKESFTYKQLLLIFALLFALQLFLQYVQKYIPDGAKILFNGFISLLTIVFLVVLITKVLTRYELMVLEKDFIIYKALLFKPKLEFSVPLKEIASIEKNFGDKKYQGKKLNYILWGIKDKLIYVITFQRDGKSYNVHFQASKKFIDKLEKTINKRIGDH